MPLPSVKEEYWLQVALPLLSENSNMVWGRGGKGRGGGIRTKFRSSKLLVFELRGFTKQRQVRVNGVQGELKTSLSKGNTLCGFYET